MQTKAYKIGDCVIALESDGKIGDSRLYSKFLSDEKADITIKIVRGTLPPAEGRLLLCNKLRKVCSNGILRYSYCSYFNSSKDCYAEFACRVSGGEQERLFVNYPGELWDKMIFEALDLPDLLLKSRKVILHCSFVHVNKKALLFSADKQVGKSTQAALWEKFGAGKTINGDRAVVGEKNGRLFAWGIPFCGTSGISENFGAPVEAIILLSQGDENTLRLLSPVEAFKGLIGKITYHQWDMKAAAAAADAVCLIADKAKVYSFSCLPDESAVRVLEKELCLK